VDDPDAGGLADLLNRDFAATAPNQRWVTDVTEFPTGDGKLYQAGIRDLFHCGIVGWDTFGRQDSTFDNAAMETFWARLKVEIAWIRGSIWFENRADAHACLFEFVEVFYNRQRHQTGLSHLTPSSEC
jgi:transposase InsO family protein